MKKKRKPKIKDFSYKPVFTDAEHRLMLKYGPGDLLDEIGVNRVMLMRTLDKMNQESQNLTFRDHLDALRAIAYTTGHITHQLEVREKLFKPYQEVENQYRAHFDDVRNILEEYGVSVYGQEKWDLMQWNILRKSMGLDEIKIDQDDSAVEEHNGTE